MAERESLCAYCGKPVYEEDGWWVDDDGNLVCEGPDGELGPHALTEAERAMDE